MECTNLEPEDYSRYAQLNVTAEMSPALFFGSGLERESDLMDWNFAKMQSANAHITIGSDWGAAPNPSMLDSVARKLEQFGNGSIERGGEIACHMMTLNGAHAVGQEAAVGSIAIGKKANFIVVDKNLAQGEFAGAQVLRTYFEGVKVWDAARPGF